MVQVGIEQQGPVAERETEVIVQRLRQSAHCDHGGSHQHATDGNLHDQQDVAECQPPPAPAGQRSGRARLDYFIGIGTEHLPNRDGAKEECTDQSQQQSDCIHLCVRASPPDGWATGETAARY